MGTRVSVIVVNYNYARFLGAAIDSALAQDYPDVEAVSYTHLTLPTKRIV